MSEALAAVYFLFYKQGLIDASLGAKALISLWLHKHGSRKTMSNKQKADVIDWKEETESKLLLLHGDI